MGEAGAGGWPGRKPSGRRHKHLSSSRDPRATLSRVSYQRCHRGPHTAMGGRMGAFRPSHPDTHFFFFPCFPK